MVYLLSKATSCFDKETNTSSILHYIFTRFLLEIYFPMIMFIDIWFHWIDNWTLLKLLNQWFYQMFISAFKPRNVWSTNAKVIFYVLLMFWYIGLRSWTLCSSCFSFLLVSTSLINSFTLSIIILGTIFSIRLGSLRITTLSLTRCFKVFCSCYVFLMFWWTGLCYWTLYSSCFSSLLLFHFSLAFLHSLGYNFWHNIFCWDGFLVDCNNFSYKVF